MHFLSSPAQENASLGSFTRRRRPGGRATGRSLKRLSVGFQSEQLEVDFEWVNRIREQLNNTVVDISVPIGETTIQAGDLVNMEVGDIIQLGTDATMPLEVKVEGIKKFLGVPGVIKGVRGVRIVESFLEGGT